MAELCGVYGCPYDAVHGTPFCVPHAEPRSGPHGVQVGYHGAYNRAWPVESRELDVPDVAPVKGEAVATLKPLVPSHGAEEAPPAAEPVGFDEPPATGWLAKAIGRLLR